jgi:hypothetical protein
MAFQSLLYPENFPKVVGGYNGYWGIEPQGKMRGSNRQVASRCSRATWMGLCVLSPISHIRYVFSTILIGSSSIKDILSRCLPSTVRRGRDRNSHPARTSAVTTQTIHEMRIVFADGTLLLEDAPESAPYAESDDRVDEYRTLRAWAEADGDGQATLQPYLRRRCRKDH